jgi:isochorismate synthase
VTSVASQSRLDSRLRNEVEDRLARNEAGLLLRLPLQIEVLQPWSPWLDGVATLGIDSGFYFGRPDAGTTMLALGHAVSLTLEADNVYLTLERTLTRLRDHALDAGMPAEPVSAFGIFPFATGGKKGGFGFNERFFVPKVLLQREGDLMRGTYQAWIEDPRELDAVEADICRIEESLKQRVPADSRTCEVLDFTAVPSRAAWEARVTAALEAIATGQANKIVLARRAVAQVEGPLPLGDTVRNLENQYPAATTFAYFQGTGVFFGCSPETLASVTGRSLAMTALAGTIGRSVDPVRDQRLLDRLTNSEKDRREHAFVVDEILRQIDSLTEGEIRSSDFILTLANVRHLATSLEGTLKPGVGILDVLRLIHPTPAICGSPTQPALEAILAIEGFDRGWYGGAVGWADSDGDGDFAIGIRSALIDQTVATVFAGCGIVEGSDPSSEWVETELKMKPVMDALGAVSTRVP